MRLVLFVLAIAGCAASTASQPCPAAPAVASPPATAPAPSGELKMRSYFFVVLRRGPTWTAEKTPETKKLFEGHMANIEAMAKSGKLLIAGPMEADPSDKTAVAGIFLFDVPTKDEVVALMKNDPAIEAKRLVPEIHVWYGPSDITYPGKLPPP
jgi:uncharacterized protein YciI